jgi:HTH-type transcriptional regulator/antitoxin HigA
MKPKYTKYVKPIRTKKDYEATLLVIDGLFDAKKDSPKGTLLEVLSVLVERYEQEHFPIEAPNPVEAIKFRMEQLGWTSKELIPILGSKSRVSEIFSRKRNLSLEMIRALHRQMGVPAESLIGS